MAKPFLPWSQSIFYEVFVQSFADGNGDGIGDLKGLEHKLEYLENLGINALWLMPVHPSPSYHKYDITNYRDIHPSYGRLEDFKNLVDTAHKRGIRVVIDLVLNHTSDMHPWFLEAKKGKDNPYRDYYVWTKDEEILNNDPVFHWHSPMDKEGKPLGDEKYYGVFWHKMPDLNLKNPLVQNELLEIARFWLQEMKVDGFRLDAAKFAIREDRPEENHAWWRYFAKEVREMKSDVFLVGEVWDGPEVIAPYLQKGFDACFNFRLGDIILKTVNTRKNSWNLVDAYLHIMHTYDAVSLEFKDATFITNHDLNRVGSVVEKKKNRMKMAAALLFTLPGIPFIYYGEELGMLGEKPDEYIREPFLWGDSSDGSQTSWETPKHSTINEVASLKRQKESPHSLFNYYKKWIHFRREHPILNLGIIAPYEEQKQVGLIAFFREYQGEKWWVIHNLGGRRKKIKPPHEFSHIQFFTRMPEMMEDGSLELASFSSVILSEEK